MVQNRLGEWALARFVQRTKVRSPKMHQNFTVTTNIICFEIKESLRYANATNGERPS